MTGDEADTRLRHAILDHARAYEIDGPDELLNEYAVVVHWQKLTEDGRSRYSTHYHSPTIPAHVAAGLFRVAERLVLDEDD